MATKGVANNILFVIVMIASLAVVFALSAFSVKETEFAIKLQFKRIVASDYKAGLHFKIPLVESVRKFDNRILTRNYPAEQFLTSEGKILRIDFYSKWQIENVDRYCQATGGEEEIAAGRLGEILKDGLKGVIARRTLQEVVSAERN